MEFKFEVRGEEVVIKVNWYKPATKGSDSGHPDNWYPGEPADFEWQILDDYSGDPIYIDDLTREEEREIEYEIVDVMSGLIEDRYEPYE